MAAGLADNDKLAAIIPKVNSMMQGLTPVPNAISEFVLYNA